MPFPLPPSTDHAGTFSASHGVDLLNARARTLPLKPASQLRVAPRTAVVAIVFMAAIGGLWMGLGSRSKKDIEDASHAVPTQTVTTCIVESQLLAVTLAVTGSLVARDESLIGSELNGLRIVEIMVEEGDWVREGQVLARLNASSLRAQLAQHEAAVEKARAAILQQTAAIKEAEATQREAESKHRRGEQMVASKAIPSEEAEARRTGAATAGAKTESARYALTAAQAELLVAEAQREQTRVQLSQTEIRAPGAGFISKRTAKLGNIVSASTELFRLVGDGLIELDAQVAENDLPAIHEGQPAQIYTLALPGGMVEGTVRKIAPTVDALTRLGVVRISLPSVPALKPGQFVRGEIALGSSPAVVVPEAAILYRDTKSYVYVVDEKSAVVQRTIQIGRRQDGFAEAREGLKAGEAIVLAGAGFLKNGDRVKVAAPSPAATLAVGKVGGPQ